MLTEQDLIREISPDERMHTDSGQYFESGLSAVRCIDPVVGEVGRILDLPCGHGRVMRALRARFPSAEIVACDILEGGVDFCAETFGAIPIYGTEDPKELEIDGTFDLIWCGSLFTHLPADRWTAFMDLFESLLARRGTLVLTTHGRRPAKRVRTGRNVLGLDAEAQARLLANFETGFAFEDFPNQSGYGISLAAPWWVVKHLERESLRLVSFAESAWHEFQDVYAARREFF